ncbi:hypothetical protein [Paenibacillus sp. FSL R5-0914]
MERKFGTVGAERSPKSFPWKATSEAYAILGFQPRAAVSNQEIRG